MDKERWNAALEKMAVYERRSAALAGQLEKKYCSGPPKGKLELEHDRKLAGPELKEHLRRMLELPQAKQVAWNTKVDQAMCRPKQKFQVAKQKAHLQRMTELHAQQSASRKAQLHKKYLGDLVKKKKLTAAEQAEAAARFHTQAMETQRKAMEDAAKKCMPHPPRPPRVVRSAGPRLQWKAEGSPGPPPGEGSPARHSGLTPVPPQT
jgi:hypothetical protein